MQNNKTLLRWIIVLAAALVLVVLVALFSMEKAPAVDNNETSGSSETQESTDSQEEDVGLTYEEYQAMSGTDRQAFFDSFETMDDFLRWLEKAKAAYEGSKNENAINGDKPIDIGDLINSKG